MNGKEDDWVRWPKTKLRSVLSQYIHASSTTLEDLQSIMHWVQTITRGDGGDGDVESGSGPFLGGVLLAKVNPSPLLRLPDDLICEVLSFVDTRTKLVSVPRLCKHLRALSEDKRAWLTMEFGSYPIPSFKLAQIIIGKHFLHSASFLSCHSVLDEHVELALEASPSISSLSVPSCPLLSDRCLSFVASLSTSLSFIDLSGCREVTDYGVSQLAQVKTLTSVNVSSLKYLSEPGIAALLSLPLLSHLNLTGTEGVYIQRAFASAPSLPPLHTLYLSQSGCGGSEVIERLSLECSSTLRCLYLESCRFDNSIGSSLSLLSLTHLSLSDCSSIGDEALCFGSGSTPLLSSLRHLNLLVTRVGDLGLRRIGSSCPHLHFICLGESSSFTDEGLLSLARGCSRLHTIYIHASYNTTDVGIGYLRSGCTALRSLHISRCHRVTPVVIQTFPSEIDITFEPV